MSQFRQLLSLSLGILAITFLGCDTKIENRTSSVSESHGTTEAPTSEESKLISVRVTGMMCPHSCLKDVKELIEKQNDIVSIELTPQKEPDVIDNPVILVRYRGDLKRDQTSKAILAAGFEKVDFFDAIK
jgi:hypothetical protein